MVYILAAILSSTSIYIIFKLAGHYHIQLTKLITINYLVASILGFGILLQFNTAFLTEMKGRLLYAVLLGIFFIVMFYLIGNSAQKAGITVTTLANKLSLVFPVLFSIIFFNEHLNAIKLAGLIAAFAAVFLTIYNPEIKRINAIRLLLPLIIFIGSGITDSLIKYIQAIIISEAETAQFTTSVFITAFILSMLVTFLPRNRKKTENKYLTAVFGVLLGAVNFGSLYFFIAALNNSNIESSLVFAIVNISIVLLSAIAGKLVFREKLSIINYAGVLTAIISLYFLL